MSVVDSIYRILFNADSSDEYKVEIKSVIPVISGDQITRITSIVLDKGYGMKRVSNNNGLPYEHLIIYNLRLIKSHNTSSQQRSFEKTGFQSSFGVPNTKAPKIVNCMKNDTNPTCSFGFQSSFGAPNTKASNYTNPTCSFGFQSSFGVPNTKTTDTLQQHSNMKNDAKPICYLGTPNTKVPTMGFSFNTDTIQQHNNMEPKYSTETKAPTAASIHTVGVEQAVSWDEYLNQRKQHLEQGILWDGKIKHFNNEINCGPSLKDAETKIRNVKETFNIENLTKVPEKINKECIKHGSYVWYNKKKSIAKVLEHDVATNSYTIDCEGRIIDTIDKFIDIINPVTTNLHSYFCNEKQDKKD